MRHLKTSEAATLLNVNPNTLRAWERRFGFPAPERSVGMHRLYLHAEVAALQEALRDGLSISSAVSRARQALADHGNSLVDALLSFEPQRADTAIEIAMSLRSVDATVEEVLLPALEEIVHDHTVESAAWAFAARWGADWLRRATRFAPPPDRQLRILVGDASRDELDRDFVYIRAFELSCLRAGIKVLRLSARGAARIGDALSVHTPNLIVLAGGHLADDAVAKWTLEVRRAVGPMPVVGYRRGDRRLPILTTGTRLLPSGPNDAQRRVLDFVEEQQAVRTVPASPTASDVRWSPASQRIVASV